MGDKSHKNYWKKWLNGNVNMYNYVKKSSISSTIHKYSKNNVYFIWQWVVFKNNAKKRLNTSLIAWLKWGVRLLNMECLLTKHPIHLLSMLEGFENHQFLWYFNEGQVFKWILYYLKVEFITIQKICWNINTYVKGVCLIKSLFSMFHKAAGLKSQESMSGSCRVATLQLIPNSLCFPSALAIFPVFFLSSKNIIFKFVNSLHYPHSHPFLSKWTIKAWIDLLQQPPLTIHKTKSQKFTDQEPGTTQPECNFSHLNCKFIIFFNSQNFPCVGGKFPV